MKKNIFFLIAYICFIFNFVSAEEITIKYTLEDCLNIAYKQNKTLLSAKAEKDLAKLNIKKAIAVCLPGIDAKSTYYKYGLLPADSKLTENNYQNQISLTQPIFNRGTFILYQQAKISVKAQRNNLEEEMNSLTLNVKESFYNLLKSRRIIELNQKAVELMEEHLKNAKALFNNGMVVETDVLSAEMELAKAQKNVLIAEQAENLSQRNLYIVMGIDLDTTIQLNENLNTANFLLQSSDFYKDKTLINRPLLKKAKEDIKISRESIALNKAGSWPVFSAYANYNWTGPTFLPKDDSWDAGINVTINLFNGGLNRLEIKETEYKYEQAKHGLWQIEQSVFLETESAYLKLKETSELININEKIYNIADKNYELTQKRYAEGLVPNTTVLEAYTSLLEAQINKFSAEYDYRISIAKLEKAVGISLNDK